MKSLFLSARVYVAEAKGEKKRKRVKKLLKITILHVIAMFLLF